MFHLLLGNSDRKGPMLNVVTPIESDANCTFILNLPEKPTEYCIYRLKIVRQNIKHEKISSVDGFSKALGICADIYKQLHGFLPDSREPIEPVTFEYSIITRDDFLAIHHRGRLYTYGLERSSLWD